MSCKHKFQMKAPMLLINSLTVLGYMFGHKLLCHNEITARPIEVISVCIVCGQIGIANISSNTLPYNAFEI